MTRIDLVGALALVLAVVAYYLLLRGMLRLRSQILMRRITRRGRQIRTTESEANGYEQLSHHSSRLIRELDQPLLEE